MANAVTASGEEGDPTSRYQNPRYSGKGVPDRANNPKRKMTKQDEQDAMDADLGEWHANESLNKKIKDRFSKERGK